MGLGADASKPVLVFRTDLLQALGWFQGYSLELGRYVPGLLAPGSSFFLGRAQAEGDERYKQIIPYVVVRHEDQILSYTRGKLSREAKLVAKQSIGFGGHVEAADWTLFTEPEELVLHTAIREVREELGLAADAGQFSLVGLLNDDSDAVGRVHFGFIYTLWPESPTIARTERQIAQVKFVPLVKAKTWSELEGWSRIVVDMLLDPRVASGRGGLPRR